MYFFPKEREDIPLANYKQMCYNANKQSGGNGFGSKYVPRGCDFHV